MAGMDVRAALLILAILCMALGLMDYSPLSPPIETVCQYGYAAASLPVGLLE